MVGESATATKVTRPARVAGLASWLANNLWKSCGSFFYCPVGIGTPALLVMAFAASARADGQLAPPLAEQVGAAVHASPAPGLSRRIAPLAVSGPPLFTVRVKVTVPPVSTFGGWRF